VACKKTTVSTPGTCGIFWKIRKYQASKQAKKKNERKRTKGAKRCKNVNQEKMLANRRVALSFPRAKRRR
jgi:hypothetical protein